MTLPCTACWNLIPECDCNESTDMAFCHRCGTEHSASLLHRFKNINKEHFHEFIDNHSLIYDPDQLHLPSVSRAYVWFVVDVILFVLGSAFFINRISEGNWSLTSVVIGGFFVLAAIVASLKLLFVRAGKVRLTFKQGNFCCDTLIGSWTIRSNRIPVQFSSRVRIVDHSKEMKGYRYQLEVKTDGQRLLFGGQTIDDDYLEDVLLWINVKLYKLKPKKVSLQDRFLKLRCPSCRRSISRGDYHIGKNVAYCRTCDRKLPLNHLHRLAEVETTDYQKFFRRHSPSPGELVMKPNRKALIAVLFFTSMFSIITLAFQNQVQAEAPLSMWDKIIGWGFTIATVFLWSGAAYGLFGKSRLVLESYKITTSCFLGPILTTRKQMPFSSHTIVSLVGSRKQRVKIKTDGESMCIDSRAINISNADHVLLWFQTNMSKLKYSRTDNVDKTYSGLRARRGGDHYDFGKS